MIAAVIAGMDELMEIVGDSVTESVAIGGGIGDQSMKFQKLQKESMNRLPIMSLQRTT